VLYRAIEENLLRANKLELRTCAYPVLAFRSDFALRHIEARNISRRRGRAICSNFSRQVRSIVLVDAKRLRLSRRKGAELEPFPFIGEKKGDV